MSSDDGRRGERTWRVLEEGKNWGRRRGRRRKRKHRIAGNTKAC